MSTTADDIKTKITSAFNKFYLNFIRDIKGHEAFKSSIRANHKVFDKYASKHIDRFVAQRGAADDDDDIELLEGHTYRNIADVLAKSDAQADADIVHGYLLIFKVLAHMYEDASSYGNDTLNIVLETIKRIKDGADVEDFDAILDDDLVGLLRELQLAFKSCFDAGIQVNIKDVAKEDVTNADAPQLDDLQKFFDNSMIGSLAKEISKEINVNDLNVSNPDDLKEMLNFDNLNNSNNVLGSVVSKVSTKIHERIANGNLKQTDLVGEAMSLMGMLNLGGMMGGMMGAGGGASASGGSSSGNALFDNLGAVMQSVLSGQQATSPQGKSKAKKTKKNVDRV